MAADGRSLPCDRQKTQHPYDTQENLSLRESILTVTSLNTGQRSVSQYRATRHNNTTQSVCSRFTSRTASGINFYRFMGHRRRTHRAPPLCLHTVASADSWICPEEDNRCQPQHVHPLRPPKTTDHFTNTTTRYCCTIHLYVKLILNTSEVIYYNFYLLCNMPYFLITNQCC